MKFRTLCSVLSAIGEKRTMFFSPKSGSFWMREVGCRKTFPHHLHICQRCTWLGELTWFDMEYEPSGLSKGRISDWTWFGLGIYIYNIYIYIVISFFSGNVLPPLALASVAMGTKICVWCWPVRKSHWSKNNATTGGPMNAHSLWLRAFAEGEGWLVGWGLD